MILSSIAYARGFSSSASLKHQLEWVCIDEEKINYRVSLIASIFMAYGHFV